jgi:hypothetical protein
VEGFISGTLLSYDHTILCRLEIFRHHRLQGNLILLRTTVPRPVTSSSEHRYGDLPAARTMSARRSEGSPRFEGPRFTCQYLECREGPVGVPRLAV